jgi:hypothetical protein
VAGQGVAEEKRNLSKVFLRKKLRERGQVFARILKKMQIFSFSKMHFKLHENAPGGGGRGLETREKGLKRVNAPRWISYPHTPS